MTEIEIELIKQELLKIISDPREDSLYKIQSIKLLQELENTKPLQQFDKLFDT